MKKCSGFDKNNDSCIIRLNKPNNDEEVTIGHTYKLKELTGEKIWDTAWYKQPKRVEGEMRKRIIEEMIEDGLPLNFTDIYETGYCVDDPNITIYEIAYPDGLNVYYYYDKIINEIIAVGNFGECEEISHILETLPKEREIWQKTHKGADIK